GYMPLPQGGPKGLKLTRDSEDHEGRVKQWLSPNGLTGAMKCCNQWGIPLELRAQFLTELWELLTETIPLLQPITFTYSSGRALRGCQNVYQIDGDRLKLTAHQGLYRCQTCRRTHLHPTPNLTCMAYRCNGNLVREPEDTDSYDLMVLDQEFSMIRPREHSAQVPTGDQEFIENMFRNERSEKINTLVCTPTLEMGVNIGALDAVLMRNVPPLPANYWQRAGRAGRQHRMAVNLTYCRGASHDRAYFQDPLKLLNGTITPPKFNLRNEVMLAKHIHAAILTGLRQLATSQGQSSTDSQRIKETIDLCFPTQVKSYLFDEEGNVRSEPLSVEPLRSLIQTHQDFLQTYLEQVLHQDPVLPGLISTETIKNCLDNTTDELTTVIRRVWKRLQWAIAELNRLDEIRRRQGTLSYEEDETQKRCDNLIKQLKGQQTRKQREAEGFDETNTFSVLASEGFLPGYGLDTGSIKGTFLTPRTIRLRDFTLNRPVATALREYIPGNMIYANSHRFFARKYQIDADSEFIPFQVDRENQVVTEITASSLNASDVVGVSLNNVDLRHQSQISDDENYRFQLAVSILGYEQQRHGEGIAYRWG
ncbi:MAG: helicase-related protein, partial [Microcystaceae cyanobacterium]